MASIGYGKPDEPHTYLTRLYDLLQERFSGQMELARSRGISDEAIIAHFSPLVPDEVIRTQFPKRTMSGFGTSNFVGAPARPFTDEELRMVRKEFTLLMRKHARETSQASVRAAYKQSVQPIYRLGPKPEAGRGRDVARSFDQADFTELDSSIERALDLLGEGQKKYTQYFEELLSGAPSSRRKLLQTIFEGSIIPQPFQGANDEEVAESIFRSLIDNQGEGAVFRNLREAFNSIEVLPAKVRRLIYDQDPYLLDLMERYRGREISFSETKIADLRQRLEELNKPGMEVRSNDWWAWRTVEKELKEEQSKLQQLNKTRPRYPSSAGLSLEAGFGQQPTAFDEAVEAAEMVDRARKIKAGQMDISYLEPKGYNTESLVARRMTGAGLLGPRSSVVPTPYVMSGGPYSGQAVEIIGRRVYSQQELAAMTGRTGITGKGVLVRPVGLDPQVLSAMGIEDIAISPIGAGSGLGEPLRAVQKFAHQKVYRNPNLSRKGQVYEERMANVAEQVEEIAGGRIYRESQRISNNVRQLFPNLDARVWQGSMSTEFSDNLLQFAPRRANLTISELSSELVTSTLWEMNGEAEIYPSVGGRALNTLDSVLQQQGELGDNMRAAFGKFLGDDNLQRILRSRDSKSRMTLLYRGIRESIRDSELQIPMNQSAATRFFRTTLKQSGIGKLKEGVSEYSLAAMTRIATDEGRVAELPENVERAAQAGRALTEPDFVTALDEFDELRQQLHSNLDIRYGVTPLTSEADYDILAHRALHYIETSIPAKHKLRSAWNRYSEETRLEFVKNMLQKGTPLQKDSSIELSNIVRYVAGSPSETLPSEFLSVVQRADFFSAMRRSLLRGMGVSNADYKAYTKMLEENPFLGPESEVITNIANMADFNQALTVNMNVEKVLENLPKTARERILSELFGGKLLPDGRFVVDPIAIKGLPIGEGIQAINGLANPTYQVPLQLAGGMTSQQAMATQLGAILEQATLQAGGNVTDPTFVDEFLAIARSFGDNTAAKYDQLTLNLEYVENMSETILGQRSFNRNQALKSLEAYLRRIIVGENQDEKVNALLNIFSGDSSFTSRMGEDIVGSQFPTLEELFTGFNQPYGGFRLVGPVGNGEPVMLSSLSDSARLRRLAEISGEKNVNAIVSRNLAHNRGGLITEILNAQNFSGEEGASVAQAWVKLSQALEAQGASLEEIERISLLIANNVETANMAGIGGKGYKHIVDSMREFSRLRANQETESVARVVYKKRIYAPLSAGTLIKEADQKNARTLADYFDDIVYQIGQDGADSEEAARLIRVVAQSLANQAKIWGEEEALNIFRPSFNGLAEYISDIKSGGGGASSTPLFDALRAGLLGGGAEEAGVDAAPRLTLRGGFDILKGEPVVKVAAAGAAVLAALGIYRSMKKEPTPQDAAGPPYLPGGSFYEDPTNIPMSPTMPTSNPFANSGGTDYIVNANGNFDPDVLRDQLSSLSGARPMSTHYYNRLQGPVEQRNALEQSIIDNY